LVELAAGVQLGHYDFSRAALGRIFVFEHDAGRHPASIVGDGNRVVGMNCHLDFGTEPCQRLVD